MTPDDGIIVLQMMMDRTLKEALTAAFLKQSTKKAKALLALATHIANNWKAICILHGSAISDELKEVAANPVTALGRCMYDALLQSLYIAVDPAKAEERAADYLAFGAVEHHQFIERILKGTSSLSQRLARSPRRVSSEDAIRKEHDRVKGRFTNHRGAVRQHWYPGNLRGLAKSVDKDEEYSWYVTYSNSSVHAGAFSVLKGPPVPLGDGSLFAAAAIACQAARLIVNELQIEVSQDSKAFMAEFSKDLCNWSPTT